jgi:hypothetical protein
MKIKSILLIVPIIIFSAFSIKLNNSEDLRKQLIGQWRNLTIHIDIMSADNTDKKEVWEANESNWEKQFKIKPIHTYFKEDNTFYSEYYTLKDSMFYRPTGKWTLKGNNLTFYYEKPKVDTLYFTVSIKDNIATFHGILDWDEDGKKDDIYDGTQRKQK